VVYGQWDRTEREAPRAGVRGILAKASEKNHIGERFFHGNRKLQVEAGFSIEKMKDITAFISCSSQSLA